MALADTGWIWEGQGLDPGVRPSIYGLGQGADYMGLSRANFMFHPNDKYAMQLMAHLDEVTCDISKWDYQRGEGNTVGSTANADPQTVMREAQKVAQLSLDFPNVTGVFDDDVMGLMKRHDMTAAQFGDVSTAMREINPKLKMWTVVYARELEDADFWQPMLPYIDVVNLWIWESKNLTQMSTQLKRCRELFADKPIVMGIYLRDYETATPVPVERVMRQIQMIAESIDRGELSGYSILGSILIEGQREQADALRDFIAAH
jgi:hypothetical protein